jgi:hypothetical protein
MRDKLREQQQPAPQQHGKFQSQKFPLKPQGVKAPPAPFMPRDIEGALLQPVAQAGGIGHYLSELTARRECRRGVVVDSVAFCATHETTSMHHGSAY